MIGKVIEVYIPDEYSSEGNLLDVMNRRVVGFKIMTDSGIERVELKQDDNNGDILPGDIVTIIKENNSINILKYNGRISNE